MARNKLNVQIALMARAAEEAARMRQVDAWRYAGHLSYRTTADPLHIDVTLGDENFHEVRRTFPTTTFVARAALAIASGQSNRNGVDSIHHSADAMSYAVFKSRNVRPPKAVWRDLAWFDEAGGFNMDTVKKITAKVTPRSNIIRGLRP